MRRPVAAVLIVLALAAGHSAGAKTQQVTLTVPTMDCATCPVTIRVALMKVPGVKKAVVSYEHRTAKVVYDDEKTDVPALTRATDGAGYPSFPADDK
jgi:mercuric ion binding protein